MSSLYPWQQSNWQMLLQQIEQQRLPHALLLTGLPSMGKLEFAHLIINFLSCEQPQQQACGQCRACQLLAAGTHPDVAVLQPEKPGAAIKVDQVRELTAKFNQSSQLGRYKLAVIEPAEAMNIASANAILKTLEEPFGDTLIILVSHQPAKLIATIRSRCQQIKFAVPQNALSESWLQQQLDRKQDVASLLALADGVPLLALDYAKTDMLKQRKTLLLELISILQQQTAPTVIAGKYYAELSLPLFLSWLMAIVSDLLKLYQQADRKTLNHINFLPELEKLSSMMTLSSTIHTIDLLKEAMKLANRPININSQLLIEKVLIQWLTVNNKR